MALTLLGVPQVDRSGAWASPPKPLTMSHDREGKPAVLGGETEKTGDFRKDSTRPGITRPEQLGSSLPGDQSA